MVPGKKQPQTFSGYYSTKFEALKSGFYVCGAFRVQAERFLCRNPAASRSRCAPETTQAVPVRRSLYACNHDHIPVIVQQPGPGMPGISRVRPLNGYILENIVNELNKFVYLRRSHAAKPLIS